MPGSGVIGVTGLVLPIALLLLLAATAAAVYLRGRLSRVAAELAAAAGHAQSLQRELAMLRRESAPLQEQYNFVTDFLREFAHLARELHSGLSVRRIPGVLLNIVGRTLGPQLAVVLVRRRASESDPGCIGRLVVAATSNPERLRPGTEIPFGHGELGWVAEVQRVMTRQDLDAQPAATRNRLRQESLPGLNVDLAAPMVFGEQTLGLIALSGPRHSSESCKAALRVVAQIGALALHNAAAYSDVKISADVDGLTGVFNKRHMTKVLAEEIFGAQQRLSSVSIFLFDIDHFKNYNDVNGHLAGDRLLQLLARLVRENTRSENIFGRFGGEEFLLILPDANRCQALIVAEKLRALIANYAFPFRERQPLGVLSVSGGVAEYPTHALDSAGLLRAADQALYTAKRLSRNLVLSTTPAYLSEGEPLEPKGADPEEDEHRVLREDPPPPSHLVRSLPPDVDYQAARALAEAAADRYPDGRTLAEDIEDVLASQPSRHRAAWTPAGCAEGTFAASSFAEESDDAEVDLLLEELTPADPPPVPRASEGESELATPISAPAERSSAAAKPGLQSAAPVPHTAPPAGHPADARSTSLPTSERRDRAIAARTVSRGTQPRAWLVAVLPLAVLVAFAVRRLPWPGQAPELTPSGVPAPPRPSPRSIEPDAVREPLDEATPLPSSVAAPPGIQPPAEPAKPFASKPAVRSARLAIRIEHPLESGSLRLWVDDKLLIDQALDSQVTKKIVVIKLREGSLEEVLEVNPGTHEVRVQVAWEDNLREKTLSGTFNSGSTRHLEIRIGRLRKNLSVEWKGFES